MSASPNRRREPLSYEEIERLNQRLNELLRRKNAQIADVVTDNDRLRVINGEQADEIDELRELLEKKLDEDEVTRQMDIAVRARNALLALSLDTTIYDDDGLS